MFRIRIALSLAALALAVPTVASAGPSFFMAYSCERGRAKVTTSSGTFAVGKRGESCADVFRKNPEHCETNGSEQTCTCKNEGTAKDFVLCAEDLIAGCEFLGCKWEQVANGDVVCTCPNNNSTD